MTVHHDLLPRMCVPVAILALAGVGIAAPISESGASAAAPAVCATTGAGSASPGITARTTSHGSFVYSGRIVCSGGLGQGTIRGTGSYTGSCAKLTASMRLSGLHTGTLTLTTTGPAVSGTGTYAGRRVSKVAATLFPTKGNCIQPFTQGAATLALQLAG
jgi:hypothetical protein